MQAAEIPQLILPCGSMGNSSLSRATILCTLADCDLNTVPGRISTFSRLLLLEFRTRFMLSRFRPVTVAWISPDEIAVPRSIVWVSIDVGVGVGMSVGVAVIDWEGVAVTDGEGMEVCAGVCEGLVDGECGCCIRIPIAPAPAITMIAINATAIIFPMADLDKRIFMFQFTFAAMANRKYKHL
jgi:hypothetical protein